MQRDEGNLSYDQNGKVIKEQRGFTERCLNVLLKKICDHESKHEAIARGLLNPDQLDEDTYKLPEEIIKKPLPLIKTLYMRDNSKIIFRVEKYNHQTLSKSYDLCNRVFSDINYDEFLMPKPEFLEKMKREEDLFNLQQK